MLDQGNKAEAPLLEHSSDRLSDPLRPALRVEEEEEVSILQLLTLLLRHRRVIVATSVISMLAGLLFALLPQRTYTSTTSFLPQGGESSALSGLSGLAGQFGVRLPAEKPGESPEFYAQLVKSREILGVLASREFRFTVWRSDEPTTLSGTLADLLKIAPETESEGLRHQRTVEWLRNKSISASTNRQTGLVTVVVRTPWPALSFTLAQQLLELLNDFNLETRQSQAAAERRFVEARLAEARDSLKAVEEALAAWLKSNRQWDNSPELAFQYDRLQRAVSLRQALVTSLAEAYDRARIAEVRNTPVITVVERPEQPVKPDSRRGFLKVSLGIMFGLMLGLFLAFGQEYLRRARQEEDYRDLSGLWAETKADFMTLGGFLGRRGRS